LIIIAQDSLIQSALFCGQYSKFLSRSPSIYGGTGWSNGFLKKCHPNGYLRGHFLVEFTKS